MAARFMEASSRMAVCGQGFVAQEEIGVFPGVDVVGHHGDVVVVPQGFA
ncbi:hypothetical protein GCM10008110_23090 [Marinobacter persicus]|nr:hypothetical protein GCM10008110_23090 [Marinobacter persicus]